MLFNCANRGTPSGGEKDVTPPVIIRSVPENYSVDFTSKEIRIYFDEYIKINDLRKQLIISPPMDPEPEITPLGTASKYITIKIHDTLQANTTYAFNFGESIVDNNESNPYPYYRYVFSTGSYIDSLSVNGYIKDALERVPDEFVSIMLYDVNEETFNDSIVYNEKPKYITNTLDSTTTFKLENLKAGKYMMVALKDENSNFTFQQKSDKIGFYSSFIDVPTDSVYELKLFKEVFDFKATRPSLISGNKIAFGYEGNADNMQIEMVSDVPDEFTEVITKDPKKDSLNYWYLPNLEVDSLVFKVTNTNYEKTVTAKIRNMERDSINIRPIESRALRLTEDFQLESNVPYKSIDESKISILDKDSTNIPFKTSFDKFKNVYSLKFDKTEENNYKIQMLPGAFTDIFDVETDSINLNIRTRAQTEYGDLRVQLQNATYPVIAQLVNTQGKVETEKIVLRNEPIDFLSILPGKYYLRVVYDANNNGIYDSGNFLKKIQPERVSYYTDELDVRAYSEQIITFILL